MSVFKLMGGSCLSGGPKELLVCLCLGPALSDVIHLKRISKEVVLDQCLCGLNCMCLIVCP